MSGLLPDDAINNEGAGEPWKKSERDAALDEYFAGAHPKQLGIKYKGAPKAFQNSILNKLKHNYRKPDSPEPLGRAERYAPVTRVSRRGARMTPNEVDFIRVHRELGLSPEITAKILCRRVDEIDHDWKRAAVVGKSTTFATSLDLLLAVRYAKLKWQEKILNDATVARMEEEEVEYGGGGPTLSRCVRLEDMPDRIKYLALYLSAWLKDEKAAAEAKERGVV